MALWTESSSSTLQLEAMDTSSSARPTYPLKDKVFHADIQIKSIEDATRDDEEYTQGNTLLEENSQSHQDADNRKQAAEMQMYWDEAIAKNMNLPDGYSKVAVLLIKWADELDELKTRSEAEELETVFRERFHYHTETVELNVKSKPQHQMNSYMSRFIETHDGANHLLIIYYTGHGVYREDRKHLELTASTNPASRKGFDKEARANWNKAEDLLRSEDVEGDVLTILDTCYSSNLAKSGKEETRTFELLSASAIDITTAAPGENSFTRALIDALHELLNDFGDRPFTTFHLNQRILLNPRRHDTPSVLWFRLQHNERHIRLAPLKPEKDRERQKSLLRHPARGYLTLRFALRDDYLTQAQIEFLTKNLAKAFNNKALVGLRRIDWMGIRPARNTHFGRAALAIFAIAQWKRFLKKRREEKLLQRAVDQVEFPFQMSIDCTTSSTRKRSREENDDLPDPKREYLDKPPSPPVSDSSLLEDMELNVPITQSPMAYFPSNS